MTSVQLQFTHRLTHSTTDSVINLTTPQKQISIIIYLHTKVIAYASLSWNFMSGITWPNTAAWQTLVFFLQNPTTNKQGINVLTPTDTLTLSFLIFLTWPLVTEQPASRPGKSNQVSVLVKNINLIFSKGLKQWKWEDSAEAQGHISPKINLRYLRGEEYFWNYVFLSAYLSHCVSYEKKNSRKNFS